MFPSAILLLATATLLELVSGRVPSPQPDPEPALALAPLRECYEHNGHVIYCHGDDVQTTTTITLVPASTTTTVTTNEGPTTTVVVTAPALTRTESVTETATVTTTTTSEVDFLLNRRGVQPTPAGEAAELLCADM